MIDDISGSHGESEGLDESCEVAESGWLLDLYSLATSGIASNACVDGSAGDGVLTRSSMKKPISRVAPRVQIELSHPLFQALGGR